MLRPLPVLRFKPGGLINMSAREHFEMLLKLAEAKDTIKFKEVLSSLSASQRLEALKEEDYEQTTLLKYAAARGATEIVKVVITLVQVSDLYSILAIPDDNGDTPLHVAAYFGCTEIVELVANAMPTADLYRLLRIQNKDGNTPLHRGLVKWETETTKRLLKYLPAADMSKVISIPNNHGTTVLSHVAEHGFMDLLKLCVNIIPREELYAHVLATDNDGDTVIHCAAGGNQSEAAVYLLNKLTENQIGEIFETQNKKGYTPIEYAKSKADYYDDDDHDGDDDFVTTVKDRLKKRRIFLKDETVKVDFHQNTSSADSGITHDVETSLVHKFAATLEASSTARPNWPITEENIVEKYLNESDVEADMINLPLRPSTQPNTEDMYNCKEKYYQMTSPIRGRCLIINNRDFEVPSTPDQVKLDDRQGSDVDVANVLNVFTQLSFICEVHSNLSSKGMLHVLNREIQNTEHERFGISAFIIMTHGIENCIYGTDSRPVKLSDILDLMSPYTFKAMAGKPKMVVIQACSGDRPDTLGFYTDDSPSAGGTTPKRKSDPFPGDYLSTDDLFLLKASFLSFRSMRHTRQGSWMIRALVCLLYNHSCDEDIETIFRKVKDIVREKSIKASKINIHIGGQQPTFECFPTHGRKLCLFPRFNPAQTE